MNLPRFFTAAGFATALLITPVAVSAQTAVSGSQQGVVLPTVTTVAGGVGGGEEVLGETVVAPASTNRGLAVTGSDVAGMAAIAGAAVVGGAALLAARRRRTA